MKAVRLHDYNQMPVIEDVPEPSIRSPLDVIVKIGGAGVCRTDLHIILGQWAEAMNQSLPVHARSRERRLGARGRLRSHECRSRRHGHPAPDADLRPVPCLSGRSGHALQQTAPSRA